MSDKTQFCGRPVAVFAKCRIRFRKPSLRCQRNTGVLSRRRKAVDTKYFDVVQCGCCSMLSALPTLSPLHRSLCCHGNTLCSSAHLVLQTQVSPCRFTGPSVSLKRLQAKSPRKYFLCSTCFNGRVRFAQLENVCVFRRT